LVIGFLVLLNNLKVYILGGRKLHTRYCMGGRKLPKLALKKKNKVVDICKLA